MPTPKTRTANNNDERKADAALLQANLRRLQAEKLRKAMEPEPEANPEREAIQNLVWHNGGFIPKADAEVLVAAAQVSKREAKNLRNALQQEQKRDREANLQAFLEGKAASHARTESRRKRLLNLEKAFSALKRKERHELLFYKDLTHEARKNHGNRISWNSVLALLCEGVEILQSNQGQLQTPTMDLCFNRMLGHDNAADHTGGEHEAFFVRLPDGNILRLKDFLNPLLETRGYAV